MNFLWDGGRVSFSKNSQYDLALPQLTTMDIQKSAENRPNSPAFFTPMEALRRDNEEPSSGVPSFLSPRNWSDVWSTCRMKRARKKTAIQVLQKLHILNINTIFTIVVMRSQSIIFELKGSMAQGDKYGRYMHKNEGLYSSWICESMMTLYVKPDER